MLFWKRNKFKKAKKNKTMKKISTDRIVGISAMFISLLTLVIFIYQTNLMRQQNYLSILPYLSLDTSINHYEGTLEFQLRNLGTGPAIIESRRIYLDNKWLDVDFGDFLEEQFIKNDTTISIQSASISRGTAIPANESITLVKVYMPKKKFPNLLEWFTKVQEDGVDYEVIYRSLYQEKWKININSDIPIELN